MFQEIENINKDKEDKKVDLKQEIDYKIERENKDVAMSKNDIYLEQVRVLDILKKKFQALLEDDKDFYLFCKSLEKKDGLIKKVDNGLMMDLKSALPSIIQELEKSSNEIFKTKIPLDDYEESLYDILTQDTKETLTKMEYGELLNVIIEEEINIAINILQESRKRPVLSHRARGFGKDEASKESLDNALKENISELEFDIRKSKDGQMVIHHNVTLGGSANRVEAIKDLDWEELKGVNLKNGEHLTTLDEFFESINKLDNKVTKINIDIKDFDEKMLKELLNLIKEYKFEHRVNIVSWFPQALQYLYEKEPNLSYSMSYFPQVRGISKMIMSKIEQNESLDPLWGKIGTWFAKRREKSLKNDNADVQSYVSEVITNALILDANEHWSLTKEKANKNKKDLVGVHEFPYGPIPNDTSIMSRVLHGGSINIMAFEEQLANIIEKTKIPILIKHKSKIINTFNRTSALENLILQCAENKIAVNLYDISSKENIENYFNFLNDIIKKYPNIKKLSRTTIYSSNKDAVKRLDSRVDKKDK